MDYEDGIIAIHELLREIDKIKYENPKRTVKLGKKAFSMSKEIGYEIGKAVALLGIGQGYVNTGKYLEALSCLFDSLSISEKENIYDLQASAYIHLGIIFLDLSDYEKGMDFFRNADMAAKKINFYTKYDNNSSYEFFAAKISTNIAEIYKLLNSYNDAFLYYNKAHNFDKKLDYKATRGITIFNLGEMNYLKGKYDKALKFVNKSLEYMKLFNDRIAEPEAYRVLALIEDKKGNFSKAMSYFQQAITVSEEVDYPYYRINALIDFSNFLKNGGDTDGALQALDKAYNISIENEIFAKTLKICTKILKIYEELNNSTEAYKYYKLYHEYENKLENKRLEQRINNIKIKSKLEDLENEKKSILEKSEELMATIKNISIISELAQKITSTLDLNEIVDMLHRSVQTFMDATAFGIGLYDDKTDTIKYEYYFEDDKKISMPDTSLYNKSSIAAHCLRNRQFIVINDTSTEYGKYIEDLDSIKITGYKFELSSVIYCPLIINNSLIGVMTVQSFKKNAFTPLHVEMIKALSSYAVIAVNNAIKSMYLQVEIEKRRLAQDELTKANNKLVYLSENDSLTGIANRRKLDSFINIEWNKERVNEDNISLILLDIDYFKEFNDNYSHLDGDNCIVMIARTIASSLTGNYFAARYGGDEFIVVLPNSELKEAMDFAELLRNRVEQLDICHKFSKIKDIVTITLGVASVTPNRNITINEFIRSADNALYSAKKRGRNQTIGVEITKTKDFIWH